MFEKFPQPNNPPETQKKTENSVSVKEVDNIAQIPEIKNQIKQLKEEVEGKKLTGPALVAEIAKIIAGAKLKAKQTK